MSKDTSADQPPQPDRGNEGDADTYFPDLIDRTTEAHIKWLERYRDTLPSDEPFMEYFESLDVAGQILRAREHFRMDNIVVADDRRVFERYQVQLRKVRDFIVDEGLSHPTATTLLKALGKELWLAGLAVDGLASAGTAPSVKNRPYNQAGRHISDMLSLCGLPYPNREAALFLWYNGGRELDQKGIVRVIDPFEDQREVAGKDPRDVLEDKARKRWRYRSKGNSRESEEAIDPLGRLAGASMRRYRQRGGSSS